MSLAPLLFIAALCVVAGADHALIVPPAQRTCMVFGSLPAEPKVPDYHLLAMLAGGP